jgi:hypothetical protein
MTSDLKSRVLAQVTATPSMTRRQGRIASAALAALSLGIAAALFEFFGGLAHSRDRPIASTVRLADGWGLVSALLAWLTLTTTRAPLRVFAAIFSPILLFFWMRQFTDAGAPGSEVACFTLAIAVGAPPLASFLGVRRGADPMHPTSLGALAGATSGALANVVLMLWCPMTETVHVLVGHALPMIVLTVIGATLGETVLAARSAQ